MCPSIGHARNKAIPNHPPIFSEIQSAEPSHTGSALCVSKRKKEISRNNGNTLGKRSIGEAMAIGLLIACGFSGSNFLPVLKDSLTSTFLFPAA